MVRFAVGEWEHGVAGLNVGKWGLYVWWGVMGRRWIIEVREIIDYYNCARDPKPMLLLICM